MTDVKNATNAEMWEELAYRNVGPRLTGQHIDTELIVTYSDGTEFCVACARIMAQRELRARAKRQVKA